MFTTTQGNQMEFSQRVIAVAAALDTRFGNPQVCALKRMDTAKNPRHKEFWRQVFSALMRPYSCQSWMQDEMDTWQRIRAVQEAA